MAINLSDLPEKYQNQIIDRLSSDPESLQKMMEGTEPEGQNPKLKYHNAPDARLSGTLKFASRKEARRYDELMMLLRGGAIRSLKLQPQFTLQESFITPEGKRVRAIQYIADFSYEKKEPASDGSTGYDWKLVVEDVKSKPTRTDKYQIKRKLMLERFGIEIREI